MTWAFKTAIDAIHAELDARLVAAGGVACPYGIGEAEHTKLAQSTRITWRHLGGRLIWSKGGGANPEVIGRDVGQFLVAFTTPTDEGTHNLQQGLMASSRAVYGVEVIFGRYVVPREGVTTKIHTIVQELTIEIDVLDSVIPTAAIEAITGGLQLSGAIVLEWNETDD